MYISINGRYLNLDMSLTDQQIAQQVIEFRTAVLSGQPVGQAQSEINGTFFGSMETNGIVIPFIETVGTDRRAIPEDLFTNLSLVQAQLSGSASASSPATGQESERARFRNRILPLIPKPPIDFVALSGEASDVHTKNYYLEMSRTTDSTARAAIMNKYRAQPYGLTLNADGNCSGYSRSSSSSSHHTKVGFKLF